MELGNSVHNKTSIIILAYNNLKFTIECLKSIRENISTELYEIVIVESGSTDGTREWLLRERDIRLVLCDENVGFPKGCNLGIEAASKDNDILLLNNDTIVYPNSLENLKIALYSSEEVGAVGATTAGNFSGALDSLGNVINLLGNNMKSIEEFAVQNNISNKERWVYTNRLIGFCMLIKREVLNQVGNLDEIFTPGTYEDNDISLRIIKAGYYLLACYDSYVHHYAGTTFDYKSSLYKSLLNKNSIKFAQKWNLYDENIYEVRSDLTVMITEDKNKEMNILQWKCDLGATLLDIKGKFPKARLYGIEENTVYNEFLNKVATISNKTTFPLEYKEDFFDYIIIGNEVDMVQNPKEFLKSIKRYLKSEGHLIMSIQNVMHYSIINNIIKGNWNYKEKEEGIRGFDDKSEILSRNNTLLLSESDIGKFLQACGYKNIYIFTWDYLIKQEDEDIIELLCKIGGVGNKKLYTTYQYTISCIKSEEQIK